MKGLWTAASGAATQFQNMDIIANNLANISTDGFKKNTATFQEYLEVKEKDHLTVGIAQGPIKDKDLHPLDGRDEAYVVMDSIYTNFAPGALKLTRRPWDIALEGEGFFEIASPNGLRYTKLGNFTISPQGILVTQQGYPVLSVDESTELKMAIPKDQKNQNFTSRYISIADEGTRFDITKEGEIYSDRDLIGKISVVEFLDKNKLTKEGGALFKNQDPGNKKPSPDTYVLSGMLESSNVNPVEELTQMIKSNRLFEQDLKSLKTFHEMMGKEANDIGKL